MKRQNLASKAPAKGAILLSRHQLMEKLACSVDTIKRLEQRGLLRPIRFNSRLIRYRLSDVDEMMTRHEAEAE